MAKRPTKAASNEPSAGEADGYEGYDAIIMNGLVEDTLFAQLSKTLGEGRKSDKAVVALVTYGGLANAAYRISRLLQNMYDDVVIFVPSLCKSAGTLIATSGSKLVISPFGEIGPLDVQLPERDEIGERKSGLTMRSALEDLRTQSFELFSDFMMEIKGRSSNNVSFRLAAELARDVTTGLMGKVYEQVHPDVLGKDFRDLSIATKYGERLNKKFGNLKPDGISRLVHDYPSHDFVIDHQEAKEIFERVELPNPRFWDLVKRHRNKLMVPKVKNFVVEIETWPTLDADAADGETENGTGSGTEGDAIAAE
jgi:Periplasmic serine proteases (ClpP class)